MYQVCQRYPHLGLNDSTLSPDAQTLRNPPIGTFLRSDPSLQRNVEEIYPLCSGSLEGASPAQKREELRRRWKACSRLRSALLFAVEPLAQTLVEAGIYLGERGDYEAALAVMSFIALRVDPYRSPMPFTAQRTKGWLMLVKLMSHTAAASYFSSVGAAAGGGAGATTARTGTKAKISEVLARTDQVAACRLALTLIAAWTPTAHASEPRLTGEAAELAHQIAALPGRPQEDIPLNITPEDERRFMDTLLGPVRELSELALDVLTEEFGT